MVWPDAGLMNKRLLTFTICATVGFTAGFVRGQERFDHKVRELIFAGMGGNQELFNQGMKLCEDALAVNPKHAEALVWHGAGLFSQAGQAFQKGDQQKGMELSVRGMAEMDKAVELAPENLGVRIPRGAVLLSAAASMNGSGPAKMFAAKALSDYEKALEMQADILASLGTHPRGELLQGLANAYRWTGQLDKAQSFYARLEQELPGTTYAKRAAKFRETGSLTAQETTCIGCHVKK
jgi:tetratricopeptide (TPR) repeat protein